MGTWSKQTRTTITTTNSTMTTTSYSVPDERDRDLLDGTWEQKYYSSDRRSRDWNTIGIGIALLFLMGLILPTILFALR